MPRQARRWRRRVIGGVAILVVLAVGGSVAGFHFIAAKAPASLTLPRSATRPGTPSTSSGPGQATLDGAWDTGPGSIAGWRVQEVFLWQQVTLTGHTSKISGSLTMSGTSVSHASFTVNMASVTTDQSQRNVLDTSAYPTATFVLTSPIELSGTPADGAVKQALATGNLSMHGITRAVRIAVSAERTGSSIYVLTDIPIAFADWHISLPDTGGLYGIKSPGTLEVLLYLTRSAGLTPTAKRRREGPPSVTQHRDTRPHRGIEPETPVPYSCRFAARRRAKRIDRPGDPLREYRSSLKDPVSRRAGGERIRQESTGSD